MSPCCRSVYLLVLLGVVMAFGSPVQYVSDVLKEAHESVADVLELKQPEIGSNPLFSSVIRSINTSCQRKEEVRLMNATLDVYMRIFSSILQHNHNQHHKKSETLLNQLSDTRRTQVASKLQTLQQNVENLKRRLSHLNLDREDVFAKLNRIKVDDPVVQRKALAEFKEIFQAASVISYSSCGHVHTS